MKSASYHIILLYVIALLLPQFALSKNGKPLFIAPPESHLDDTDVFLLSVGLGEDLYARFGHTVIRVVDKKSGHEQNLNWGLFDFQDPLFAYKFFRGQLDYRLGDDTYGNIISTYNYFQRPVYQQRINLTSKQKQILFNRFAWNAQPENITYRYQYFFNNCATKPRDYLDEAIGGKIKEAYANAITDKTFRDYVYANLNAPPIIAFSLDLTMNGRIDRKISKWEEMFLPLKLEEYLAELPAYDDDGVAVPGQKLLSERKTLVVGKEFPSSLLDMYHMIGGVWLLWLIVTAFMFGQPPLPAPKGQDTLYVLHAPHQGKAFVSLGIMTLVWALASFAYGTIMLLWWFTSDHLDLQRSLNLLWLWPTDILLVILGFYFIRYRKIFAGPKSGLNSLFFRSYIKAHLVCSFIFMIMGVLNIAEQNIRRPALTLLPLQILLLFIIMQKGLTQQAVSPPSSDEQS